MVNDPKFPHTVCRMECRWSSEEPAVQARLETEFWKSAQWQPITKEWNGDEADSRWETAFASRWTANFLYFAFQTRFLNLTMSESPEIGKRTHALWEKEDVVEVFLSPDIQTIECYREFELSPSSQWIDIDIDQQSCHKNFGWESGVECCSQINHSRSDWRSEMRIPHIAFRPVIFQTESEVGLNAFRVELKSNLYLAWSPTLTLRPDFHVPARFGRMVLVK